MKFGLCSCGEFLTYMCKIDESSFATDNTITTVSLYRCPMCSKQYIYKTSIEVKEVE